MRLQRRQHLGDRNAAIDSLSDAFLGVHAVGKTVNEMRIGLQHQGNQRFLSLGGERFLGGAVQRVPRVVVIRLHGIRAMDDPVEVAAQADNPFLLPFVFDMPVIGIAGGTTGKIAEVLQFSLAGRSNRTNTGKCGLAGAYPAVDQPRMVDQKGRHAKPG